MNVFESVGSSVRRVALWSLCAGFACGAWAAWADGEAAERFVKIDGDNAADGLTWDTAWRTIQYAVDNSPSGATITVGPGEYGISVAKEVGVQMWALNLTNSVRIVSSEGPAATIIDAARSDTADTITSPRAEVRCTAANAALCGFTIRGGSGSSKGNTSGVAFSGKDSVLSNCTISISSQWGGAIVAFSGGAKGFDLKFTGYSLSEYGYILNLSGAGTVVDRFAWKGQNWVRLYSPITVSGGAILRNALIANITNSANYATVNVSGSGSRIESCTVAGCRSTGSASPFQCDAAAIVTNSIIAHNEVTLASYANIQGNANLNRFFSCCCPQLPEGERGNVAGDPQFVGAADYHLLVQSAHAARRVPGGRHGRRAGRAGAALSGGIPHAGARPPHSARRHGDPIPQMRHLPGGQMNRIKHQKKPPFSGRFSCCYRINTSASERLRPSSCGERWAFHNVHACVPQPERRHERTAA